MTAHVPTYPQPLRRDLIDPRSTSNAAPRPGRPLLNDRRSTRG